MTEPEPSLAPPPASATPGATATAAGLATPEGKPTGDVSGGQVWALRGLFYGALALIVVVMLQDVPREAVGGLSIALMLVLLLMKVPVAIAMATAGAFGIWVLSGVGVLSATFGDVPFRNVSRWSLSVLPMFVLMGLLLWRSGATERLYRASSHWLGWMPGGLAAGTNFTGAGLAAVTGSTLGVTYALARVGIPEMLKAGYDRRLAMASVLMAGTGGQLIPPSIMLVIYAGVASVPVGPLLMAGLVPGIVLAAVYGIMLVVLAALVPRLTNAADDVAERDDLPERATGQVTWRDRGASLIQIWPLPVLGIGLLSGLYAGVFTATEVGAFGSVGAILVAAWYLGLRRVWPAIGASIIETLRVSGAIFLLVIGAMILNRLVTVSGLGSWLASVVSDANLTRVQFLLVLLVLYVVLGMFMDPLTMILVTVPIFMPMLAQLEISLLWFGVFVVLLGELAIITPPVGILTFIVYRIAQDPEVNQGRDIRLGDVFASVGWFLPVTIAVLLGMILFPEFVEWLPGRMR